jgi:hypothetical protein
LTREQKNAKMWVSLAHTGSSNDPQISNSIDAESLERSGDLGDGAAGRDQRPVNLRMP